ncbi:MAG: hypothetical protein J5802_10205 [Butyrivibrio sp.]|nr:hypothetical protein [Butyrivibrio sp.]
MRGEKKIDYQKIFIYMMIFAWMIGFAVTLNENSEYDVIRFGNAHFHLPKRITENLERTEGENYVFLQSDDYLVLGVGPDCEGVDDAILEQFNISFEDLKEIDSIKYETELIKLVGENDGVIVESGKTNKPSYDIYVMRHRLREREKIIIAYKEDNKCAIQILCAPKGDITKKELDYMYGGIRFDEQDT